MILLTLAAVSGVLLGMYLLGRHFERHGRRPSKRGGNSRCQVRETVLAIVRNDDGIVRKVRGK